MSSSQSDDLSAKIRLILTELKPLDHYAELYARVMTDIRDPPSYVAEIVLVGMGGFQRWKQGEKSRWQVQLLFRGVEFQVRDWKGYSLSIDAKTKSPEVQKLAVPLLERLRSAGRLLDEELQKYAKSAKESGDFWLVNTYPKARRLYEQFRTDLVDTLGALDDHQRAGIPAHKVEIPPGAIAAEDKVASEFFNRYSALSRKVAGYGCAAIVFYFASLEVLMDILYPFLDRQPDAFVPFREGKMDERFKGIFPVSNGDDIKEIYEGLLDVWRKIRNVVVHGYGGEAGVLVSLGRFGLVPVSYPSMLEAPHFEIFPIDPELGKSALDLFQRMDDWLRSHTPYNFVLRYAESESVIPFTKEEVQKVRQRMQSKEEFEEYLREKAALEDYLSEQY